MVDSIGFGLRQIVAVVGRWLWRGSTIIIIRGRNRIVGMVLVGEVNFGFLSSDFTSFFVVGSGGFFRRVKSAQPNPHAFPGVPNLGSPFAPGSLPDSSV